MHEGIAAFGMAMTVAFTASVVMATSTDDISTTTADAKEQYTLSNQWKSARQRLATLEEWANPYTFDSLDKVNIQKGWHCLDAGAGLGGVTHWLAERVGPEGTVTALDMDPHFLQEITDANVRILEQNLVTDDLPQETYDCIFARDVLMHIPEREQVIKKFVAALKPGGVLITEDLGRLPEQIIYQDFSGDKAVNDMAEGALLDLERDAHMSFVSAYASPRYFKESGLVKVAGHAGSTVKTGNNIEGKVMELSLQQLRSLFLEKGYDQAIYDEYARTYLDDSAHWWGFVRVTSIGYKPF